jgi:hypothetical protein
LAARSQSHGYREEAGPGESGTDSTGASVPSWTVGEAAVEIGSRTFELRDVVAITQTG